MKEPSSGLPVVHHNLARGRSYYSGPFSPGDFILPSLTPHGSLSIKKRLDGRSKRTITENDDTNSYSNIKVLETEPAPYPTPEIFILKDYSPIKLRAKEELRNVNKTPVNISSKRRVKLIKAAPNIDSYLDYLGSTPSYNNATSFASKLREKVVAQKENSIASSSKNDSFDDGRPFLMDEILIPGRMKTPTSRLIDTKRPDSKASIYYDMGSIMRKPSSRVLATEISERMDSTTRSTLRHSVSLSKSRRRQVWEASGKDDETVANELAEEVVANYRVFMTNAAKNKDFQAKMQYIMRSQDVLQVFQGKVYKALPLSVRIYKDMTENEDNIEPEQYKTPKKLKGKSLSGLSKLTVLKKASAIKIKIIPAKYKAYQAVNKELVNINTKFKVQGLQVLEGKLIQAHDDFVKKKKQVLKTVQKQDISKYFDLRAQCEGVEDAISFYHKYKKEKDDDESEVGDKEVLLMNKGLENIMKTWEKNLTEHN